MLRVPFRFTVADARQRVPTIEYFHSLRGKGRQALGWTVSQRFVSPQE